jgi:hypothetical protein
VTAQTLEWLRLLEEAASRERTMVLLDNAIAALAGQATQDGFKDFMRDLKKQIK